MNNDLSQTSIPDVIKSLFPNSVTGIIQPIDDHLSDLHPDELGIIHSASSKRKFEFSTGRWCAKQALASQGIQDISIVSGKHREPVWPKGFVGSISHCKDQCGAVIAKNSELQSIGFDVENIKNLKNDIARIVCTDEEKEWIKNQNRHPYNVLVLLIFSLKESVYKCIYQYTQTRIGFKDCTITPELESNRASLIFHRNDMNPDIQLQYFINNKHIYSGACYQ